MEISSVLNIAGAATGGGLLGAFGGLFSKGLEAWNKKKDLEHNLAMITIKNQHELDMNDKAKEMMLLEYEQKARVATTEAEMAETSAAMTAMVASYATDKASYATGSIAGNSKWFVFVDVVRGLTRPLLTLYLDVVLTYYGWMLHKSLNVAVLVAGNDNQLILQLMMQIIEALIFMATTATMWWFAARGIKPQK